MLVTMAGEEVAILLVALLIYWCIDKKRGFSIASSLLFALSASMVVKAIVRQSRPFQVLSSIHGKRLSTATGYSFPSGHTTGASSFYSAIMALFGVKPVRCLCLALIILIPISRLYLGVHWPIDIVGGLIIGLGIPFFCLKTFEALEGERKARFTLAIGTGATIMGAILGILLQCGKVDPVAFGDLVSTFSLFGGFYLGASQDTGFSTNCTYRKKALRYLGGVLGIMLIMALKKIIPSDAYAIGKVVRYVALGLWATWIWPLVGKRLAIFD